MLPPGHPRMYIRTYVHMHRQMDNPKNASNAIYRMSRGINIPPTKHGRGKYTNILKREK